MANDTVTVTLRLPRDLYDLIKHATEHEDRPFTRQVIRMLRHEIVQSAERHTIEARRGR